MKYFFFLSLCFITLSCSVFAQTSPLPKEILPLVQQKNPQLIAQYEPAKGARYYIIETEESPEHMAYANFYKVELGKATLLGSHFATYPFSRFIKDPVIVSKLWHDFLNRWIQEEGREVIQKRLDDRAGLAISEEEIHFFKQAGFEIPENAIPVKDYEENH